MLKELDIENLAIIKKSVIDFHDGFNVITGETGAGKSIIISAINMILGQRANLDVIGPNGNSCKIQAIFDLSYFKDDTYNLLPDIAKSDTTNEKELIICRIINKDKSRIYINGILSNLSTLELVTSKIISLCNQNEHVDLLNPAYHLTVLDRYSKLDDKLKEYKEKYKNYKELEKQYNTFELKRNETALRIAELNAIKEDLETVNLSNGKHAFLENEIKKFTEIEKIQELSNEISDFLMNDNGLFCIVNEINKRLNKISKCDESATYLEDNFASLQPLISDFENEFNKYSSSLNVDNDYLENLREELSDIAKLERKYATNEAGLITMYEKIVSELNSYKDFDNFDKLKDKVIEAKQEVSKLAQLLSNERKIFAKKLQENVKLELSELNLPNAKFEVQFNRTEIDETGGDDVEFMLSLNKGYEVKPLKKIASGGELSRILLVLKKILKDKYGVNVLVFDEVDSGMSGKTARAVGIKLKELSSTSQVICITHLPQVASLADTHYKVFKNDSNLVLSQIIEIKGEDRIEEIARMIAGYEVTEASKASARELIAS